MEIVTGIVVDGPMKDEVISQFGDGSAGFGHCDENDDETYKHYSWESLKEGETVENPIDDRVITGRWKLDDKPSTIMNIDGVDTRAVILEA